MNNEECLSIPERKAIVMMVQATLLRLSKNCLVISMLNQIDRDFEIEAAKVLWWNHTLVWLLANYWVNDDETEQNYSQRRRLPHGPARDKTAPQVAKGKNA